MVQLEGGEFLMGTDDPIGFPNDGEGPVRTVTLRPFWIDTVAVSNARFAKFVDATGYLTEAERYGWSFVFGGLLPLTQHAGGRPPRHGSRGRVRAKRIRALQRLGQRLGVVL